MDHQLSHFFYLRKSKKTKDKLYPINLRIIVNRKRIEYSTRRYVEKRDWIQEAGRLKKNSDDHKEINNYLDSLTAKIHRIERELVQEGKTVTFYDFRQAWLGQTGKKKMLMEVFKEHNLKMAALVKTGEVAPGTMQRYQTSFDHTENFLKDHYRVTDIPISALNYEFASNYEFWLKTVRECEHNTTMKYIGNLKKIINICLRSGWLAKDPFFGFKRTHRKVYKEPLTIEEIELIAEKVFPVERLTVVRDIFLFCCFTGLAYADVKKLLRIEIAKSATGEYSITTFRQKTDGKSHIPLLQMAVDILEKYKDHPACVDKGVAFPVLSNQKMNAYLKEIADLCGITKPLTFHIARHTFATTVALENGITMETVSKILGHNVLRSTEGYAHVTERKIKAEMGNLKKKEGFIGNQSLPIEPSPSQTPLPNPAQQQPVPQTGKIEVAMAKKELADQLRQLGFKDIQTILGGRIHAIPWEQEVFFPYNDPGFEGAQFTFYAHVENGHAAIHRIGYLFTNSHIHAARSYRLEDGPLPSYPRMQMELNIQLHVKIAQDWMASHPGIASALQELGFDKSTDQITFKGRSENAMTLLIIGPALNDSSRRLVFTLEFKSVWGDAVLQSVEAGYMQEEEQDGKLRLTGPTDVRKFNEVDNRYPTRAEMIQKMIGDSGGMGTSTWTPPSFLA